MNIFENSLIICHIAIYTRGIAWFNLYRVSKHIRNILIIDMERKNNKAEIVQKKAIEVFNERKFGYPYTTYSEIMDKVYLNIIKNNIYDSDSPSFPTTHLPYCFSANKHGIINTKKYEYRINNSVYVLCPFCFNTINNNIKNINTHLFKKCNRDYRRKICSKCHTYHSIRFDCPLNNSIKLNQLYKNNK
jgi:hypothetical protein